MRQARSQRYDRLTPADCALLHEASIAILERTGVRIHDAEAVERLRGAGTRVGDDGRVFVPGSLVEWALDVAPKSVRLHDRSGAPALALQGDNAYFGVGSDCMNIIDHRTGTQRAAVLQDAVDGLTVVDALPNMSFGMSMFLPSDVDPAMAARVDRILADHRPPPLPEDATGAIAGILDRAAATPRSAPQP